MSAEAGGGGGGGGPSPTVKIVRSNKLGHFQTMRNKSHLPPNIMNTIASYLPNFDWEEILRGHLGFAYTPILINDRIFIETPPIFLEGRRRFNGTNDVLNAYIAYLYSETFSKLRGVRATADRKRLLEDLLCKTVNAPYEQFKIVIEEGVDINGSKCEGTSIIERTLQSGEYDKFIYAAEHGGNAVNPHMHRELHRIGNITKYVNVPGDKPIDIIYSKWRTSLLAVLYMLLRHPEQFTEEQYTFLVGKYSKPNNKAKIIRALERLRAMINTRDVKHSLSSAAFAPEGERFRNLIVASLGEEMAADALKVIFIRLRRSGTVAPLLVKHSRNIMLPRTIGGGKRTRRRTT